MGRCTNREKYIPNTYEFHNKNNVLWKNGVNVTIDGRTALSGIKFGVWDKDTEIASGAPG